MTEPGGLIRSRYFDKRDDLVLDPDEIVLIGCVRNELLRLPYFLQYYRELGIDRFLIVDNNSDDGTREYLAGQADVEYFHTDASFRGSAAGRMWIQELGETYATGHWVLYADVDELLVYPGVELFGIRDFCRYLDNQGFEGLFTVMLDFYSDVPLDQSTYESGTDFRETCPFFEVDSYRLTPADYPPFLSVWRGPRGRLEADDGPKNAFLQRKVPLVKWNRGFSFVVAAHYVRFIPLADATGALLHFKFFSTWVDRMVADHARGDRKSTSYAFYKEQADHDLCFYGSHSLRYRDSRDLVRLGVMAAPAPLRRFYQKELRDRGQDLAVDAILPDAVPAEGGFTLRSIAALWRFVNNPDMARFFGQLKPTPGERQRLVREMSESVQVIDVWPDRILLRIGRAALHSRTSGGLGLAVYVDGRLIDRVTLDDSAASLEVEVDALMSSVYRWNVDVRQGLSGGGERPTVEVYLEDNSSTASPGAAGSGESGPAPGDVRVFSREWFPEQVAMRDTEDYQGVVDRYAGDELRGWAFDARNRDFALPVAVYLDGRLAAYAQATVPRPGLAEKMGLPGPTGRGFRTKLPRGFFGSQGVASVRVEVRIAGTNVSLDRAPFQLPTDADTLEWAPDRRWFVPTTPPTAPRGRPAQRAGTSRNSTIGHGGAPRVWSRLKGIARTVAARSR